jgi:ATP-binding cassette subfamily B protein
MADFFDSDEPVTKGYDRGIVRRILGYMRPYVGIILAAALSLIVGTAGELYIPVLVKDTVDDALMVSYLAADPSRLPPSSTLVRSGDPVVEGRTIIPASRLAGTTGATRRGLEATGALDGEAIYLARLSPTGDPRRAGEESALAAARALASARDLPPGSVAVEGDYATLPMGILKALAPGDAGALRTRDSETVSHNVLVLLAILLVVLVATFFQAWLANLVGQRIMKDMRMQIFRHAASRSLAFLSKQPVGRLVTRMTSDVETINQFFTDVLAAFLKDASLMAGVLAVLFILDWRLALVTLATLPPVAIVAAISRTRARDAFKRQRTWLSKVNAYLAERISGMSVVKLFVQEAASSREFHGKDAELKKANLGEMYVYATFRPIVDFLGSLTSATVIYFGARMFGLELLSLGTLIAFINLIGMFYSPIQDLSEKYTLLQSAMAGGERVFKLLDSTDRIEDRPTGPMPARIGGGIDFDRVRFAYKPGEWILKDLSFSVRPGEMVAIVGPTGAGKTTVTNLITRLWDIQEGEIRLDGRPVRDLPLDGLRRAVQPVLQDVFLFSGTIADNIRLGPEVSEERMRVAARAVHADEFIERLPDGYATVLAEGGSNLSSGQRQILSFARVLAHDPAVIILDEATSSVDTETERMIQRGLEGLLAGRTSVVIAHRLSTIRHADRILVLAGGKVAEEGRHEELLERRGLYWNLYRLQYGGGSIAEAREGRGL